MTVQELAARRNAALQRSVADLGRVEQFTATDYMVESSGGRGRYYLVVVEGGEYRCRCAAGQAGTPCRHAAAVYRVRHHLGAARVEVRG